jgi:hypothetical protein
MTTLLLRRAKIRPTISFAALSIRQQSLKPSWRQIHVCSRVTSFCAEILARASTHDQSKPSIGASRTWSCSTKGVLTSTTSLPTLTSVRYSGTWNWGSDTSKSGNTNEASGSGEQGATSGIGMIPKDETPDPSGIDPEVQREVLDTCGKLHTSIMELNEKVRVDVNYLTHFFSFNEPRQWIDDKCTGITTFAISYVGWPSRSHAFLIFSFAFTLCHCYF